MAFTIVSLISDQTIPNVQFIKEFAGLADSFLFISTPEMERNKASKSEWIKKACVLSDRKCKTIQIDNSDLNDIELKVLDEINPENEYLVNLTGGNKLTAIACFNIFQEFKSKIYYINIGSQAYEQIFPRPQHREKIPLQKNLTIHEYLAAYGMTISERETKFSNFPEAERLYYEVQRHNSRFEEIPEIFAAKENPDKGVRGFYAGGWFEEYIYARLKTELKLNLNQIAYQVKLEKGETKNEYDVIFMHQNEIYVVECKAYSNNGNLINIKSKIESSLYKLAALNDDFGLRANSLFITSLPLRSISSEINRTMQKRAVELGVAFIQLSDLKNKLLNK